VQRRDNFSGRSFYEHIFPADTLAFGWSSSSLHWLSTAPGHIPDRFCVHQSHDSASRIAYAARSTSDWTTFLDHRSVELQVGGVVVIVDVLRGDGGLVGSEALFDCLAGALRAALEQGVLSSFAHSSRPVSPHNSTPARRSGQSPAAQADLGPNTRPHRRACHIGIDMV
jgi:hypothetical protein